MQPRYALQETFDEYPSDLQLAMLGTRSLWRTARDQEAHRGEDLRRTSLMLRGVTERAISSPEALAERGACSCRCDGRAMALFGVKAFHSFAFFVIQSSILYLLYKGARGQTDRGVAVAAAIAMTESAIYAGNGFRCPLTSLAEDLGAESGSVTDIFLPRWLAAHGARIYTPMLLVALTLHARNLSRRQLDFGAERHLGMGPSGYDDDQGRCSRL